MSDEEEESTSISQHVSRLHVPPQRVRSRHKSSSRARSLSKGQASADQVIEGRSSSHSRSVDQVKYDYLKREDKSLTTMFFKKNQS